MFRPEKKADDHFDGSRPTNILKDSPVLHRLALQYLQKQSYLLEFNISLLSLCQENLICSSYLCLPWYEASFGLSHSAGPITLDVVLSEVVPELRWQRQTVYALVGGAAADHSPAQVLEGEREGSR